MERERVKEKPRILIIDDDKGVCFTLSQMVKQEGHDVTTKHTKKEGIGELFSIEYDIVFLDVRLPDGNGLDVLPKLLGAPSKPEIIIMTGHGDPDGAELAIKHGAWDYIKKPSPIEKMRLPFLRALQYRKKKTKQQILTHLKRESICGNSPELNRCLNLVGKAANSESSVLLTGETGTGKELFARAIHENSQRAKNAFVVVDCAALPGNLIESILFGHDKGAYTGAEQKREGLIREADGGTLFLDEVGELPLQQQRAFLRILQEKRFRPIGSNKDRSSDFRCIAATNQNLDQMVTAGAFRRDLFFRLRTLAIHLPPLRDRIPDIRDIASHYLLKLSDKFGSGQKGYSPEFFEAITAYHWPGNVRELIHAIENALSESREEPTLFPVHLPTHIRSCLAKESFGKQTLKTAAPKTINSPGSFPNLKDLISKTEKKYFQDLITCTKGEIKEICRISGLSRANVYTRFKKYDLTKFSS